MKIVTTFHPYDLKLSGITAALVTVHPTTTIWLPKRKPAFDMFDELQPDLIFCKPEDFDAGFLTALKEYKTDMVVFGEYCPPIVQPKLLCSNLKPAANIVQINSGQIKPKYKSDILYISNVELGFNTQILDMVTQLTSLQEKPIQIKLCGMQALPFAQYVGPVSINHITNLLVSTKIALDHNYNIMMDAAFNKVFCLTNVESPIDGVISLSGNLHEQIRYLLDNEKYRKFCVKKAYKYARENTYFHRLADILQNLYLSELASLSINKVKELIND